ncbi:MAG: single-stranded DNA-binding protein [Firmicutes bacterium]|nr:single-stranded DNA-binding protein [Bacillota bacterium]
MNKAILMGRLTRDPELRYTSNTNTAVCNFTLAVDRRFSRQGEEKQTDFIPIVVWGKTAEFCSRYFQKGQQVAVVGRIQTRTWDDNEGKRHYVTEVIAEEAYFADSKRDESSMHRPADNMMDGSGQESNAELAKEDGFYQIEDNDDLPF